MRDARFVGRLTKSKLTKEACDDKQINKVVFLTKV
jgi:hypothetical protein